MSLNVLVVDDSRTTRRILRSCLQGLERELGRVEEAGHGEEALGRLRQGGIHAMLLDLNMPVMNGLELLETLRSEGRLQGLAVVVISSESEAAAAELAALGVDVALNKPFEAQQLEGALARALREAPSATEG
jgi:CheY-like chemotaxis protein